MSAVPPTVCEIPQPALRVLPALDTDALRFTSLPVLLGLLLLYGPTYFDVAGVFWANDREAHGFIVLAIWLWLVWRERAAFAVQHRTARGSVVGWVLLSFGALCYAIGRSQQVFQLEVGSQLLILPGVVLVLWGPAALRRLWFPWVFLLFIVPLPGSLVDSLLVPLKEGTAAVVTQLLFSAGLPVARDGVVIYAGPYQLFIADACSGLNQLMALAAIGAMYAYVAGHRARVFNLLLLAAIVPVALLANLFRVLLLVLATYYGGDAFEQQLHDYAGYLEILLAFGGFFALDRWLRRVAR